MISIVVIEYNNLSEIQSFCDSVRDNIDIDHEIIISSNSQYTKSEQADILSNYSSEKWVFNDKNGGFAYGMNGGLRIAKGDVLIVMNPDVKLKSTLKPMIDYLLAHPEVGIIAPKIVDENGTIQDSFRHFFSPWSFIMRQLGWIKNHGELHVTDLKEPVHGDWVIGAFMLVKRDFYEKVGGMSEDYFMYCEDMDWCKRAHLVGYDVVYYPDVVVEYKGTRAARKSWKYAKIHLQSLFTYWRKFGIWG